MVPRPHAEEQNVGGTKNRKRETERKSYILPRPFCMSNSPAQDSGLRLEGHSLERATRKDWLFKPQRVWVRSRSIWKRGEFRENLPPKQRAHHCFLCLALQRDVGRKRLGQAIEKNIVLLFYTFLWGDKHLNTLEFSNKCQLSDS